MPMVAVSTPRTILRVENRRNGSLCVHLHLDANWDRLKSTEIRLSIPLALI